MKNLKHNGIYIPAYDCKSLSIKIQDKIVKLRPRTEQMALAWARKRQSITSPPDQVYYRNFIRDFLETLVKEHPSEKSMEDLCANYSDNSEATEGDNLANKELREDPKINFSEVSKYVTQEQNRKLNISKEEKKRIREERKTRREALREKYGSAIVDGKKLEIANWTAEPSCIFAGRGNHPKRGKWKEGPKQEDVILNLSPDSPRPSGKWKGFVWQPEKMYIAKWQDKLSGKMKYVWFSDSAFLKQKAEQEKFRKAENLGKKIPKIEAHILQNLSSKDKERRKIATVSWLILEVNIRVGDEKDPGESDTVGAITLRPEHIKIEGDVVEFDFLGKDSVRWIKQVNAPPDVIRNIEDFSKECEEYLFKGIDSRRVSKFLSEKMQGLTAKVFRTWRCTKIVEEYLQKCKTKKEDTEYSKKFCAKMANLEAAKVANHKRKISAKFEERLAKKETKLEELEIKLKEKKEQGKKVEAVLKRLEKGRLDLKLFKETREYNLATSLKSYIDPMTYVKWATTIDFPLDKIYTKTLRKKFSWALGVEC